MWTNFFNDDVIIVMSSVHRTQSICIIFSTSNPSYLASDKQHRNEKHINLES